ncbi:MAG: hypothetical protein RL514_4414 [Verrucomicrobiota bacterium]
MKTPVPYKQTINGTPYWVARLGRGLAGGTEQKHYFRERREAKEFIASKLTVTRRFGDEAKDIPLCLLSEVLVCAKKLEAHKVSLTTATDYYLKHAIPAGGVRDCTALREEFLASRESRSCRDTTLTEYRSKLRIFCEEFGDQPANEVAQADVEDWLDDLDVVARTKQGYLKTLLTLFNYALRKGYVTRNVLLGIEPPIVEDRPPGILEPVGAERFLRAAWEHHRKLVPALVVSLFGSARRREVFEMDGQDIHLDERLIEILAAKAKTRQRRLLTVNDTLLAWLTRTDLPEGRLVKCESIDTFGERIREIADLAGIKPWPHNALRHSFSSYFLGKTNNENVTAAEMGNSPAVVIHHYRAVVWPAATQMFWDILPDPKAFPELDGLD